MKISSKRLNIYLMLHLPSAWLCGVRVKEIDGQKCITGVRHRWINQNPFNSLYFAVQAMAAELSTGALVMDAINKSGKGMSMLVAQNKARFTKKATGKIRYTCPDGFVLSRAIENAVSSGAGQTFWMSSVGRDDQGDEVATFEFEWTIKVRSQKEESVGS